MANDESGSASRRTTGAALPAGYPQVLEQLKAEVRFARHRAHRAVNTELLRLHWTIGRAILDQQSAEGWGAKVIDRLAEDLRSQFPDMKGLSRSNLEYMRRFAAAYPPARHDPGLPPQAVGELPWGHVRALLDKVEDQATRDWYAAGAVEHGWSRNVLVHQIANRTHERSAAASPNVGPTPGRQPPETPAASHGAAPHAG